MPIKRSQSAPQPIKSLFTTPNPRAATFRGPQTSLPRSKSYLVDQSATNSPLSTPWIEREDPFNLGGFFPASPRAAPEEEEQWKWLRKEEDEDDKESVSFSVDSAIEQLEDASAEETIKSEDKFGVLSLNTMFTITESEADDRLFSPYAEEEAIDNDSLYLSLRARRRANSGDQDTKSDETWTLFFPPESEDI
ncbi:hypothetical protein PILCRDRAFT_827281 [Piloderma croceum F 1598]|uniref:Uncharacterized protein n=1 Tax=Piloderma croceum (strain F 1598) TaxID=765440 RepID=A0A0C3BDK4_PILCF|nr:hypothetical protein PILCRDRAFT_827281 [Piloderma croceum F 1598]